MLLDRLIRTIIIIDIRTGGGVACYSDHQYLSARSENDFRLQGIVKMFMNKRNSIFTKMEN